MVQFSITEVRDHDNIPLEAIPRITITNSEGESKPRDDNEDSDEESGGLVGILSFEHVCEKTNNLGYEQV